MSHCHWFCMILLSAVWILGQPTCRWSPSPKELTSESSRRCAKSQTDLMFGAFRLQIASDAFLNSVSSIIWDSLRSALKSLARFIQTLKASQSPSQSSFNSWNWPSQAFLNWLPVSVPLQNYHRPIATAVAAEILDQAHVAFGVSLRSPLLSATGTWNRNIL